MIRRNKKNSPLHSFVQNILPKCPNYLGAWCSLGALLFRPSPTSGFDPCLYTKSTPPFSGRGAFGWAGRGQECSCPEGRNIGALRSRAKPGWARNAPPEPCFSAHPPRLASTPAFIRKAPLPFQGEVLLVGLAGVRNVPAQRAGTLGPCAHAQSPDGRATLPRSLASSPIPHVWLRPLPLYEKHPSLFREGCFWLGWQGSNLRCGSQSPMPYRLATAQYKKKRTLFCIKSALSLWGG